MRLCIKYLFLMLAFIAVIAQACKTKQLLPYEYVQWMNQEENGLRVKKSIGDFEFALQYKSPEYIVLQENKSDSIRAERMSRRAKELEGFQYYTLFIRSQTAEELLKAGITNESEYYARLEYYTAPAQDDLLLVENGDTLPCLLYHFERNYGLSPQSAIVLGFEKGKDFLTADKQFIYNDRVLSTGPVLLTIKASDIQLIPSIRYVND